MPRNTQHASDVTATTLGGRQLTTGGPPSRISNCPHSRSSTPRILLPDQIFRRHDSASARANLARTKMFLAICLSAMWAQSFSSMSYTFLIS